MNLITGIADVPFWWLMARVSGILGYLLIVGSMVSGVVLHTRLVQKLVSGRTFGFWDSPLRKLRNLRKCGLSPLHFRSFRDFRRGGTQD